MGFLSYEHPQVIKNQLDLKGKLVQRMMFNIPLDDDCYIRDCTLLPHNNVAVITNSKQLIIQGQEQNGLHSEMMTFYN